MAESTPLFSIILKSAAIAALYISNFAVGQPTVTSENSFALEPEAESEAEALSNFAWGFFLHLDPAVGLDKAMGFYQKALAEKPDSEIILDHVIGPLMVQKRFDRIVSILEPIARQHREVGRLQLLLADAYRTLDQPAKAADVLAAAADADGWQDPEIVRSLIVCHRLAAQYADAERVIRKALRRNPLRDSMMIQHVLALHYFSLLESAPAELSEKERERLRQRSLLHAREAAARVDQVESPIELENLIELLRSFEAWDPLIAVLQRTQANPRYNLPQYQALLADALLQKGELGAALRVLDELAADKALPPAAYIQMGQLYLQAGQGAKAAAVYERLLDKIPEDNAPRMRVLLAQLYLQLDRPAQAVDILKAVQSLHGLLLRGTAYLRMNQPQQAGECLQHAIEPLNQLTADNAEAVQLLLTGATLAEELKETVNTVAFARRALSFAPDDPVTQNFLGYVLADHNQSLDEAEGLIARALEAEPQNNAYIDSMAWVYYRQGRHREALPLILKAVRLSESLADAVILDHAGDICEQNGLYLLADAFWHEAAEAWTGNETGRDAVRLKQKRLQPQTEIPAAHR